MSLRLEVEIVEEAPSAEPVQSVAGTGFAQLYVQKVTIRSFRGIKNCCLELEPDLTILVGRNNAGKSRILRALHIAIAGAQVDRDDLTVGGPSKAEIDVVLAPRASSGSGGEEVFDDPIARRLQDTQAISDDPPRERFAWRTTISGGSREGFGVSANRTVLTFDRDKSEWSQSEHLTLLNADQASIVAADLAHTGRDLAEEVGKRGSAIRRVLDDLEIEDGKRIQLEDALGDLGKEIASSSQSLAALLEALNQVQDSIDSMGKPSLKPLPVRLEELARSVSIELDSGSGDLPVRFHGSGARSLASLQIQGVLYDRRLGRDGPSLRPHPVSLIEEPEAHLHPQAQFELATLLGSIQGQVIVSTHSSHLASVVEPESIRILRDADGQTTVVDFKPLPEGTPGALRARRPAFNAEEMERLRRQIERPFGELLFASIVVMGDGATERAMLPRLFRSALRGRAHGICVVDPESLASPFAIAVAKFSELVGIPWFLFSDSDEAGHRDAKGLVAAHGQEDEGRITWVHTNANGLDVGGEAGDMATESLFLDFDPDLCLETCKELGYTEGRDQNLLVFMKGKKGTLGASLAKALIAKHPWTETRDEAHWRWPAPIHRLIHKLDDILPGKTAKHEPAKT